MTPFKPAYHDQLKNVLDFNWRTSHTPSSNLTDKYSCQTGCVSTIVNKIDRSDRGWSSDSLDCFSTKLTLNVWRRISLLPVCRFQPNLAETQPWLVSTKLLNMVWIGSIADEWQGSKDMVIDQKTASHTRQPRCRLWGHQSRCLKNSSTLPVCGDRLHSTGYPVRWTCVIT